MATISHLGSKPFSTVPTFFKYYKMFYAINYRYSSFKRGDMVKKGNSRSHTIIIVMFTILIIPIKGNAQIKENDVSDKGQIINKTTLQQKQINKTIRSKSQLSNSSNFLYRIKDLEKRLLLSKTELIKIKKNEGELEAESNVKADASKKYKGIVDCYRTALLAWDDMNRREGLTEQEHSVIRIELRRSIFSCPPI